ncbi:DNA polymerase III subunit delta' C-terminal domain-containing protein [Buchnera aphidicola]|uniref:DNA polymerase III subunit delta' n=1 Tax=Buchnera aphidicola (Cinara strobi) TaxID=1921549 RepID=A0A3B1DLM2_9GAMM|nr:DNA polymerase III subunit delta' C-terminal domain-containing protein [Buchnera aphidicola]VAX76601.1 DNA polymerase III subunit delta' [Buchnera aphidicola (Cinara strobi)]
MKHYPWLKSQYIEIIEKYCKYKLHPIILIQACKGIGISQLIYKISKWILCYKKKHYKSCNECLSCQLIKKKNHPDFYIFYNKTKKIGINVIRQMIHNINYTSQQGGSKIIWFSNINKITNEANNALLKTLEEPPNNTFFFLHTTNIMQIHPTIKSRSNIYYINTPKEKNNILWLNNKIKIYSLVQIVTALRINRNAPIAAYKFFKKKIFQERNLLMKAINQYIFDHKKINFLQKIYNYNEQKVIKWICYLLLDTINYSISKKCRIKNLDQVYLIKKITQVNKLQVLNKNLLSWIKCKYLLSNSYKVDKKLIFTEQFLLWVDIFKK